MISKAALRGSAAALILGILSLGSSIAPAVASTSDYTRQQASQGRQIYQTHCSQCHGSDLKGQAGPALAGPGFKSSLQFSKMSTQQLFDFISQQMPADAPGSLSHQQYLRVLAYLLSKNGYPAGGKELNPDRFKAVKLLPYPGGSGGQKSSSQ